MEVMDYPECAFTFAMYDECVVAVAFVTITQLLFKFIICTRVFETELIYSRHEHWEAFSHHFNPRTLQCLTAATLTYSMLFYSLLAAASIYERNKAHWNTFLVTVYVMLSKNTSMQHSFQLKRV